LWQVAGMKLEVTEKSRARREGDEAREAPRQHGKVARAR